MIHIFWYTLYSVFLYSKTGLFGCIFLFEYSFLCKFTYLHLLSGLLGRVRQKIYEGRKKYFGLTNISFQCHISSWNTPISIRKWSQNFKKVSGSPIFGLLKTGIFTNIGRQKIGLPVTSAKFWNYFLIVIGVFQEDVWHWNETFVNPKYFFQPSYILWQILPCNPLSKCK